MPQISIIQRLILGFGLIITLLVLAVMVSLRAGNQLAMQVDILTGEVAPTLVQSRSVTKDLFMQDKVLRGLLTLQTSDDVSKGRAELARWQQVFEQDLALLGNKASHHPAMISRIHALTEQQTTYWQLATQIVDSYAANLKSQQILTEDTSLTRDNKRLQGDLAMLVETLGAQTQECAGQPAGAVIHQYTGGDEAAGYGPYCGATGRQPDTQQGYPAPTPDTGDQTAQAGERLWRQDRSGAVGGHPV
ncbi:hypothetical protein QHE53_14990 [Aeromonas salmonicida]|nr:hypothetical protein [Aeromonas salmonicida]MDH7628058.1 hypothetical protein [Aeromonas salmonicida]WCH38538.1 hypothetical protein ONZ57_13915 [Aeromonas salmonicida]WCH50398.1 hypothetical protein ONZ63_12575 [Aeromonas salmonicida]GAJ49544.1 hypothetical protein ASA01S_053_00050 [Aeromonas salmonicida subsp. masoucida NBRC 13784]